MQVQIINVEVENKGKYDVAEVTYKDLDSNKTQAKKIMSFANKEVFNTVKNAKKGDTFDVKLTKDDKGYWQWSGISAAGSAGPETGSATTAKTSGTNPVPRSTYETAEERAQKQVYIIRQSSLGHAIETLKTDKKSPSKEEVVELASFYEDYVFGKATNTVVPLAKLPVVDDELGDDIPF